jgi:hypothetical protein
MSSPSALPRAWLQRRITPDDPTFRDRPGGRNLRPGDELWSCRGDRESRETLAGRMGHVILRDGMVVDHVGTRAVR